MSFLAGVYAFELSLMGTSMIEYINSHEGVEWMPLSGMALEFKEGSITGVEIEGGADG